MEKLTEKFEEILSKYRKGIDWLYDESLNSVPKLEDVLTHAQAKEQLLNAVKAYTKYVIGEDDPEATKGQRYYKTKRNRYRNSLRIEQKVRAKQTL